tara:strand:+ start:795 stop:1964 length:1170 start_codon:yes stop_codon:yes gene_type:complete
MSNIPLSVPNIKGNEKKYINECLDTEWVSSAGKYVDLFEKNIADYVGSKHAVAFVNGTSALQVSLRLAGVVSGDEVIVPTLTFIAPVNSIIYNNAHPVFMDSDDYYNMNVEKTIDFIKTNTSFKNGSTYNIKTKRKISAIIPVHVWGNAVDILELLKLCKERNIKIIEDSSESLGTVYNSDSLEKKHTGTLGLFGCFSFNGNKIITAGGGGMMVTNNEILAEEAKYLTTQAKDDPIRYIHNSIGYNFRLTNIQAALGVAQLENLPSFIKRKKEIYQKYLKLINPIDGLEIARSPNYSNNNHWLNVLKIDTKIYKENKEELMLRLSKSNIQTRPVWYLNHLQKLYKKYQGFNIENAINLFEVSLCLPSSTNIRNKDIDFIAMLLNNKDFK